jgi:hypothetical protein
MSDPAKKPKRTTGRRDAGNWLRVRADWTWK